MESSPDFMKLHPKDSIIKAIHIDDEAFNKQLVRKSLYYSNIIIWTVVFFYPLLGIVDYIYAYDIYQVLVLVKVITILIIYAVYDICSRLSLSPLIPLHVSFTTIGINAAILCNIVSFEVAPIFFLVYATLFMLFNLAVFWRPSYSFGHFFSTLIFIVVAFHLLNIGSVDIFITQGAGLFIMTGFFSCFIPVARYSIIRRNTLNDMKVKNSTAQLHVLHDALSEKNMEIEESNSQLTELVMQQDTFLSLVKQDIEVFIGGINLAAKDIRATGVAKETTGVIEDNISRLEQLVELFPNENEALESEVIVFLEEIALISSLNAVAKCMQTLFASYNVSFEINPFNEDTSVKLDQLYFDQMLFNLLANSLKFSIPGSRITASLKGTSKQPILILSCFEPIADPAHFLSDWYPEHPAPQSLQKGLGPGFYIARLLAKKMNSEVIYHHQAHYAAYEIKFETPL